MEIATHNVKVVAIHIFYDGYPQEETVGIMGIK